MRALRFCACLLSHGSLGAALPSVALQRRPVRLGVLGCSSWVLCSEGRAAQ